jgi:hypothetical protein
LAGDTIRNEKPEGVNVTTAFAQVLDTSTIGLGTNSGVLILYNADFSFTAFGSSSTSESITVRVLFGGSTTGLTSLGDQVTQLSTFQLNERRRISLALISNRASGNQDIVVQAMISNGTASVENQALVALELKGLTGNPHVPLARSRTRGSDK